MNFIRAVSGCLQLGRINTDEIHVANLFFKRVMTTLDHGSVACIRVLCHLYWTLGQPSYMWCVQKHHCTLDIGI